jgi:hypothetical protein
MKNSVLISMMIIVCFAAVAGAASKDLVLYRAAGNYWYASHTQNANVWLNYVTTTFVDGSPLGTGVAFQPLIGDVTGDGIDDIVATWGGGDDPNRMNWTAGHSTIDWYTGIGLFSTAVTSTMTFGPPISGGGHGINDVIARFLADINGDASDDAIYVDTGYYWKGGYSSGGLSKTAYGVTGPYQWGIAGDIPLVGNFNGDLNAENTWGDANIMDICVYRPSDGGWYVSKSSGGLGGGGTAPVGYFGLSTDTPLVGDINGDGRDDGIVVSDFDADGNLEWRAAYADPNGTIDYHGGDPNWITGARFGLAGDVPFVADINGDGKADIGVIRTSNISGNKYVYVSFTTSGGLFNAASQYTGIATTDDRAMYGATGDISLIGQVGNPPTNVNGSELPDEVVCVYQVEGDTNGDCVVNLADLTDFAGNWLINCVTTPGDPECTY